MGKRLPKNASNWGTSGGSMKKHARSGTPHNHRVTIEMNRDRQREMEREAEIVRRNRSGMTDNVKDLFKNL